MSKNLLSVVTDFLTGSPQNAASPFRPIATAKAPGQSWEPPSGVNVPAGVDMTPRPGVPMDNPRIVRPKADEFANDPFPSAATLRAIAEYFTEDGGEPIATKEELAKLEAIDAEWMKFAQFMQQHADHTNAKTAYAAHREDIAKRIAAGDPTVHSVRPMTLQEFVAEEYQRKAFPKDEMKRLEREAWAVCQPIYQRFAEAAEYVAEAIEASEVRRFATFAVPYRMSPVVRAIHKAANMARNANFATAGRPKGMIAFLPV